MSLSIFVKNNLFIVISFLLLIISFIYFRKNLKVIDLSQIYTNYLSCFSNDKKTIISLLLIPAILAQLTYFFLPINSDIVDFLYLVISILIAMLFTWTSILGDKKSTVEKMGDYNQYGDTLEVLTEVFYIVYYETLICLSIILLCFFIPITYQLKPIYSFGNIYISGLSILGCITYLYFYHFLFNFLILLKRTYILNGLEK